MFERNELYKVYKISVPIIDMLVPYWNLYIRVGGINIIDSIELPKEYSAVKDSCANSIESIILILCRSRVCK